MESLEIVTERMMEIDKGKKDFNEIKSYINYLTYEELKHIKQDLEVLEIIKKKRVDVAELRGILIYMDDDKEALEDYNSIRFIDRRLTLEELLKLKQWLEENDEKE